MDGEPRDALRAHEVAGPDYVCWSFVEPGESFPSRTGLEMLLAGAAAVPLLLVCALMGSRLVHSAGWTAFDEGRMLQGAAVGGVVGWVLLTLAVEASVKARPMVRSVTLTRGEIELREQGGPLPERVQRVALSDVRSVAVVQPEARVMLVINRDIATSMELAGSPEVIRAVAGVLARAVGEALVRPGGASQIPQLLEQLRAEDQASHSPR